MKIFTKAVVLAAVAISTLFSCQQNESNNAATTAEVQAAEADSVQKERRPAPEFFIIPQELAKNRVWLCDDGISDIFHVKNNCPVFMTCKSTKRNVSLPRAIEEYGMYNCHTCSEELNHIFDEDKIRMGQEKP